MRKGRKSRKPNVVFFDLETTGFDRPIRPVQIGAIDSWGENTYNQFVWPRRHVHPKATLTNKFFTRRGTLFREGEGALDTIDLVDALKSFLDWLESLGGNVVLVAHKCLDYDAKVLLRNLEEFKIEYSHIILGFSDSLLASRNLYPGAPSHRLPAMLGEVGLYIRESHDALDDAEDCRRICRRMAGQCRYKFLDFVFEEMWYHSLDDQWIWTFPSGVVTV